ncbi:B12-binding domain-containing radical SAM protein [Thermodesulfobacteriota bacterium]
MRIVLVPSPVSDHYFAGNLVPTGTLSVATVLRHSGFDVRILDINSMDEDVSVEETVTRVQALMPDVVGLSTWCSHYTRSLEFAQRCKQLMPDVPVVFGGPTASSTARPTVETFHEIDLVVRGECEHTIVQVMSALGDREKLRTIPGLTFRDGSEIVSTPSASPIRNLNSVPFPDFDLMPSLSRIKGTPHHPFFIEVGRGCPFRCTYCCLEGVSMGRYRRRSSDSLVHFIRKLVQNDAKEYFYFVHDNFSFARSRIAEFCQCLQLEGLDMGWRCSSRADCLDDELLERMAAAGCKSIFMGIESGSPRMQTITKKGLDLNHVVSIARRIVDLGMSFSASFIIGLPQENLEDLEASMRLMAELECIGDPDVLSVYPYMAAPLPGSALYEEYGTGLRFDGVFSDVSWVRLTDYEIGLIQRYPDVFPQFYYYPTPHLDRRLVTRLQRFMLILLHMRYTLLLLLNAPELGFPGSLLCELPPPEFSPKFQPKGVHSVEIGDLQIALDFISRRFGSMGLRDHPVHDVMKYELTLRKVQHDKTGRYSNELEYFTYDVKSWVHRVSPNARSVSVSEISRDPNAVLFAKQDSDVVAYKLPVDIGLSSRPFQ